MLKKKTYSKYLFILFIFTNLINIFAEKSHNSKNYSTFSKNIQSNYLVKNLIKQDCGKAQIVEFFSYSCPACFKINPYFENLKKKYKNSDSISFKQIPVVFHETWNNSAKLFLTISKLDNNQTLNNFAFNYINEKSITDFTDSNIKQILNAYNSKHPKLHIELSDFFTIYNSSVINRDLKESIRLFYIFNLSSSPVFVINGKYKVSPKSFNNLKTMFEIIEEIAKKEKIDCSK